MPDQPFRPSRADSRGMPFFDVRTGSREAPMIPNFDSNFTFYLTIGVFVVLALFGLPIAVRVWNDTRLGVDPETDSPEDVLTPLSVAFQSGQMSEEEYHRIQSSVERVIMPLEQSTGASFEEILARVTKPKAKEPPEESVEKTSGQGPPVAPSETD